MDDEQREKTLRENLQRIENAKKSKIATLVVGNYSRQIKDFSMFKLPKGEYELYIRGNVPQKPIPTSERLPTKEDGDYVWVYNKLTEEWDKESWGWVSLGIYTHWLPLSAIPEPE